MVVADRARWPGLGSGPEHDQHAVSVRAIEMVDSLSLYCSCPGDIAEVAFEVV